MHDSWVLVVSTSSEHFTCLSTSTVAFQSTERMRLELGHGHKPTDDLNVHVLLYHPSHCLGLSAFILSDYTVPTIKISFL